MVRKRLLITIPFGVFEGINIPIDPLLVLELVLESDPDEELEDDLDVEPEEELEEELDAEPDEELDDELVKVFPPLEEELLVVIGLITSKISCLVEMQLTLVHRIGVNVQVIV